METIKIVKIGVITKLFEFESYGFIKDQENNSYFFHFSYIINNEKLVVGDMVNFTPMIRKKGFKALQISKTLTNEVNKNNHLKLIRKISDEWLLDGIHENNGKLFYYIEEIDEIISGKKCFVIGRKGTGKTAIAEYLYQLNDTHVYTDKLSFTNFPINELYNKKDSQYSLQNQYIAVWKCIIYGSILKMMSLNENIEPSVLMSLRKLFPLDPLETLDKKIKAITENEFSISIAGNTLSTKAKEKPEKGNQTFVEKYQNYEELIRNYIDDSKYFVVIDALDDDYSDVEMKEQYFYLLNGLFKAVQEIKSRFPISKYNILPVVFLRDDIYRQINDSDKTKWLDFVVRLYWNKVKMKKMLAYRISRTIDSESLLDNFEKAWKDIFDFPNIRFKNTNKEVFEFIYEQTYVRPRDFIVLIKLCCDRALKNNTFIDEGILFKTMDSFSKYLVEDIEYETLPMISEIKEVLSVLMQIRKNIFTFDEFKKQLKLATERGVLTTTKTPEIIANELYNFNIIGNLTEKDIEVFKMFNISSSFNYNERIIIKKGLELALGM